MFYLGMAFGIAVGAILGYLSCRTSKANGVLRIDKGKADEKSLYRFEIDDLDAVDSKEYILLRVDAKAKLR